MQIETRRAWLGQAIAAGAATASPSPATADVRLAEHLRRRSRTWLPFDWKQEIEPRPEALPGRPRLLGGPRDGELWRLRAAAIPKNLWQPRDREPVKLAPPNPEGNGGRADLFFELAAGWLSTGDEFYSNEAIRAMLRVSEYPHWGGANGKPKDTDLDGGGLLMGVGVAYDTFFERLSPADRKTVRGKLVLQAQRMYAHHSKRTLVQWEQNHTYIALGGLFCAAAALYDEVPEARQWFHLGVKSIRTAVHLLDGGDGAFYEGLGYWNYGFALHLMPQLEMFRNVTGADPFAAFGSLRRLKYYLLHGLMPDGRHWLNLGDTGHSAVALALLGRARYVMLQLAAEYRDPECRFLADYFAQLAKLEPARDPWTLGSWDPGVPARDPRSSWPPFHRFHDLDMVMERSGWSEQASYMALRCGPALGHRATAILTRGEVTGWKPASGHVHPDLNSLVLFDHGEHMVVDTGYTWTKLTRDHSTVAIDGGGQTGDGERWPNFLPWERHGKIGSYLALAGEYSYLRGEAAPGYQEPLRLRRFDRHIMMLPDADATCLLVHDVLESDLAHRYEWLLLTMQAAVRTGAGEYRMQSGKRVLTIRLLSPSGLAGAVEPVMVTERPVKGSTPKRGSRLTLAAGSPSRDFEIQVLLSLHAAEIPAPPVETLDGALRIRRGTFADTLAPTGSGAGLASDGRHAAACHQQDRLLRWGVNQATRFAISGREVCSSSVPLSAVCSLRAGRIAATLEMNSPGQVGLYAPAKPARCRRNGETIDFTYDSGTRMLRLRLGAGRHELELI